MRPQRKNGRRRRLSFAPWLAHYERRKDTLPIRILRASWIVIAVLLLFVLGGADLAEWMLK